MALIVRIVSADGKKVISKVLPALPSRIKVPEGAHVEVIDKDTGVRQSLGRYINDHTRHDNKDEPRHDNNAERVHVETVQEWSEAEAWLSHMDRDLGYDVTTADWFAAGSESKGGEVLGLDKTPLIIGGALGALAAVGAAVASGGGGGPKDKIAPLAPTGLALATADDTGKSSTDAITSKTSVTINGTAEPGSSVELFNGSPSASLGKVTAGADGKFTKTVELTDGSHNIFARATDNAGNVGAATAAFKVVIDTIAPTAATAPDLNSLDDTGTSNTDNNTRNTSGLSFGGTVEAGATVELFDGTTSLGKATADATSGAYTLDVALAEGTHSITAVVTDVAGNAGAASPATVVVVDTTAPPAPSVLDLSPVSDNGSSTTDNITSITTNLQISGTAAPGSIMQLIEGGNVANAIATATADSSGTFVFSLNTTVGEHVLTARATDLAGNIGLAGPTLTINVVASPQAAEISASSSDLLLASMDHGTASLDHTGDTGTSFG